MDEPVVPDGRSEGEQALGDASEDARGSAAAMLFQAELSFEGPVDRLDALADPSQAGRRLRLISALRSEQSSAVVGGQLCKLTAGKALVGNDEHAGAGRRVARWAVWAEQVVSGWKSPSEAAAMWGVETLRATGTALPLRDDPVRKMVLARRDG